MNVDIRANASHGVVVSQERPGSEQTVNGRIIQHRPRSGRCVQAPRNQVMCFIRIRMRFAVWPIYPSTFERIGKTPEQEDIGVDGRHRVGVSRTCGRTSKFQLLPSDIVRLACVQSPGLI